MGTMPRVDILQDTVDSFGDKVTNVLQYGIYQSSNWDDPAFTTYSEPIEIRRNHGEYIRFVTEYINNTDRTFNFGPHADAEEMCNLFAWFVPAWHDGETLYDNLND